MPQSNGGSRRGRPRHPPDPRPRHPPDPCYFNRNDMLLLHQSLTASLYKTKTNRTNKENKSVVAVILTTLVAGVVTCPALLQLEVKMLAPVYSSSVEGLNSCITSFVIYYILIWVIPAIFYCLGIARRRNHLLLPWIFLCGLHALVVEIVILGFVVPTMNDPYGSSGSNLLVWYLINSVAFLLLLVATPLVLWTPIKVYIYMDGHLDHAPTTQVTKPDDDVTAALDQTWDNQEDVEAANTRLGHRRRLRRLVTRSRRRFLRMTTSSRALPLRPASTNMATSSLTPNASLTASTSMATSSVNDPDLAGQGLDRLDTSAMRDEDVSGFIDEILIENGIMEEEHEEAPDGLPPSYSQAEGMDKPPEYDDVEARRISFGKFKIVLDKKCSRVVAFRKPSRPKQYDEDQL